MRVHITVAIDGMGVLNGAVPVPKIWIRPNNQRREADAAKAKLSIPGGDHLTLLNVYNQYQLSSSP